MKYLLMIFILVLPAVSLFSQDMQEEITDQDITIFSDYRELPDDYVYIDAEEKSPMAAFAYSLLFPGLGQIYTEHPIHGAFHTTFSFLFLVPAVASIATEEPEIAGPFFVLYSLNMLVSAIIAPIQAQLFNEDLRKRRAWLKSKGINLSLYQKYGSSGLQLSYSF